MILSANGSGGNQEGLSSVLLPGMAPRNGSQEFPWDRALAEDRAQEAAPRTAGCCAAPALTALSSHSCSCSLISPKAASVSTEEPGEGIPPPHKNTHIRLPSTQANLLQ